MRLIYKFQFNTLIVVAPNGRCEHAAERTSSPLVQRASNDWGSPLDQLRSTAPCASPHFWSILPDRLHALCMLHNTSSRATMGLRS